MSSTNTALDSGEYLHLAIEAMGRDDHGAALRYLKDGADKFPQNAQVAYLLGAEYAQIGLYDRAEIEMQRAVALDSSLYTASFQLGLLQMTHGKVDQAALSWTNLDALPESHSLQHFRAGLLALAADRFAEARTLLEAGMRCNDFSPDLNRDMENLLARFPEVAPLESSAPETTGHVWFQAYQNPDTPN